MGDGGWWLRLISVLSLSLKLNNTFACSHRVKYNLYLFHALRATGSFLATTRYLETSLGSFFSLTNMHFCPSWNKSMHFFTLSENCSSVSVLSLRYFLANILLTSQSARSMVPRSFWYPGSIILYTVSTSSQYLFTYSVSQKLANQFLSEEYLPFPSLLFLTVQEHHCTGQLDVFSAVH